MIKPTHRPPPNDLGVVCYNTQSGRPIPRKQLRALYDLVIGPVHKEVVAELRRDLQVCAP